MIKWMYLGSRGTRILKFGIGQFLWHAFIYSSFILYLYLFTYMSIFNYLFIFYYKMFNYFYNAINFAEYFYIILVTGYNCFWSLLSLWSLSKKLRNTLFQQVVSVLVVLSSWCFTPNNLIQNLYIILEDSDTM